MRRASLVVALVVLGVLLVVGVALAANFTGTAGPDTITGTNSADKIAGGGGSDTLKGLAGDDKLWADFGNDKLLGNTGDDLLVTYDQSGGDTAIGGDGFDTCVVDRDDDIQGCDRVIPPPPA